MQGAPQPSPLRRPTEGSTPRDPTPYAVIGANHESADAGFRDRLYFEEEKVPAVLKNLREGGVGQAVLISTCDRIEFHIAARDREAATRLVERIIADKVGMRPAQSAEQIIRRYDDDAVRHIFRVACALKSQVIGESQVLGQVKDAFALSKSNGMVGHDLDVLYQATFALAKHVRSETSIGEGAVTVASVGIQVARDLHGALENSGLLVVGLGDVGGLLLHQFRLAGVRRAVLTGTSRRTERAARRAECHFAPIDDLQDQLADADIVVTASSTGRFLIDRPMIKTALKARRGRPIVLFDCGIPADVDPAVSKEDACFLYTLEDIERLAREGKFGRGEAATAAARMVDDALANFRKARAALDGVPGLVALRNHFEAIRHEVLESHPAADREEITRLLVNRLLHGPSEALRAIAEEGDSADFRDTVTVNRVLARLYGLQPGDLGIDIREDGAGSQPLEEREKS